LKKNTAVRRKPARNPKRNTKRSAAFSSITWIRDLATPYLRDYRLIAARERGLQGYWFIAGAPAEFKSTSASDASPRVTKAQFGFFVGYLTEVEGKFAFLHPEPPECLICAWISPVNGALHRRLVHQQGSLVRKTFEYIRWLTHRPPRFVFHEGKAAAMARHASMKGWPQAKRQHFSRNFFIETLAWLVRSGLVRKLKEESAEPIIGNS
jgi:hypothetical protein